MITGMALFKVKTGTRLVDYLAGLGYSRTKIKQLLKYRAVEVNGQAVSSISHAVLPGDIVAVRKEKQEPAPEPSLGIRIVFEDDALIVIEKPAGLLTIASETEKVKTAYYQLNEFLRKRSAGTGERIFIVHRLDRDTSGLLMFAKSEAVKIALQSSWKTAEKRYCAVVEGTPEKKEETIESYLRETKSLKVYSSREQGTAKHAATKYRIVKHGREYALLDIVLETGRKNQIRVHLADIGHPVAGDKKYGARTDPFKRLALHACFLSFTHPVTGEVMRFESTIPDRFNLLTKR
jgi:23S rRNA pseudouridine1911/1915/1917 synthase